MEIWRKQWFVVLSVVATCLVAVWLGWLWLKPSREGKHMPPFVHLGDQLVLRTSAQAIWVYHEWELAGHERLIELTEACPTSDSHAQIRVTRKTLLGELVVSDSEWNCEVEGEGGSITLTFGCNELGRYFFVVVPAGSGRPQPGQGFDEDLDQLKRWGIIPKVYATEAVSPETPLL